jgi:hypothetical protein
MNATMNISVAGITAETLTRKAVYVAVTQGVTEARAIPNTSIVGGKVEAGTTLELYDTSPAETLRVWSEIREAYGLGCCWIVVSDDGTETYAGCIKLWGPYAAAGWPGTVWTVDDPWGIGAETFPTRQDRETSLRETVGRGVARHRLDG